MVSHFHLLLGMALAAIVAALAYRTHALTRSGAWAAWAVGTAVFGIGGWPAAGALLMFFGTSTVLSRWRKTRKDALGYEKGGRRDAWQVLANGGVGAVCLLLTLAGVKVGTLLFLAALAAANADTWATEIGSALGGRPIDIRTGRRAEAGTSGAISLPGIAAALAGAALLGLFASSLPAFLIVTLAGFGGALYDTLLGAAVQALWRDPSDPEQWTEKAQVGPPGRGVRLIGNDTVNFLCTLTAVGLAAGLARLF